MNLSNIVNKMIQKNLLKILFIENLQADAELAVIQLRKDNLRFDYTTVSTRADLINALNEFKPDLIISDYMIPEFNGLQALKVIKEFNSEIPFILFTDSVDEETVVECIKTGAQNYVLKGHLARLPFAVREALEQVLIKREMKATNLLLKDSEERLQSIFSAAPAGIGLIVKGIILEVNDTFCEITGFSRKELIGSDGRMIFPTIEEFQLKESESARQIAEKFSASIETRFKCRNGNILDILLNIAPLDKNDLSKGFTFTALDITKRKQAEIALSQTEKRFRNLYNDAAIGLYRTNSKGEILLANKTLVKMLGFQSFEELAAQNLNESAYSPTYQRKSFIDDIEREGEIKDKEAVWLSRDGKEIFLRENAKAIYNQDGKILYYDGTVQDITEQKKVTDALNKINNLFETLAKASPVGIFRTNATGYTTYVNPKWSELSGISQEEAYGYGWLNAVHPEDREKLSEIWLKDFKARNESSIEYRFLKPDGRIIWVMGKAVPEVSGNEVAGYIGTITDITERKQAEDRLRRSEERLKLIFEYAPDAYYLSDLKGILVDGNIACEKLLGYSKNELIGKSFLKLNLLSFKQLPRAAKLLVMNSMGQGTGPDEFELTRQNGSKVTVEIITHPVKIKGITLVLGIARDINERKRTEKVIRESEEKYRNIFENVQDLYYETSIDGTILEISPSIEPLSKGQYKRDDLIGKSMDDFYSDLTQRDTLLNTLKKRGFVSDFEIALKIRNGLIIPCSVSAKIIFDINENPEKIIGSMHDITDRKNAIDALRLGKEKAEASDRLKTAFLNNISHEVRTPLNGILGFAELISVPDLSEEEKSDSISLLHESSDRLLNTITDYMDISLITSGNMSVNNKTFIPGQLLRKIYENSNPKCSKKKLELLLQIPGQAKTLPVYSDPEIFQKIISHLLDNAIKFTEKGSINLGFIKHEKDLEFFVKDTGIGIGKESLGIIFDNFTKGDTGPLRLTEGSGLGLSIVRGLIEVLAGTISVESEIGAGSRFSFTIPLIKDAEITLSAASGDTPEKIPKDALILVAEDDETNFLYLSSLLNRETEATILHAWNGREAIELFKANPGIVLILMDIKMPEIDGFEATRQIKLMNKDIPVVGITAYAMTGDKERVLAAGCDGYLSKPISKKNLMNKIAEVLKK